MEYLYLIGAFVFAAVLGSIIVPKILLISHKKGLFDVPDHRKLHKSPIPRLGGLSFTPVITIVVSFFVGVYSIFHTQYFVLADLPIQTLASFSLFVVGLVLLYLVGVADDLIGVSYKYKFIIQIFASIMLVLGGNWIHNLNGFLGIYEIPYIIGLGLTLFCVVYITNSINLIDGVDGLASGISCIALFAFSVIHILNHDIIHALLSLSTLGVVVPFWFYNVFGNAQRGHKLFMGDTGSLALGYILSFEVIHLCITPVHSNLLPNSNLVLAFSALLVPMFDVVRVVCRRLRNGKSPFLPDKNHFHHKLLAAGLTPRQVMVTILLISSSFIILNSVLSVYLNITFIVLLDVVLWLAIHFGINSAVQRKTKQLTVK